MDGAMFDVLFHIMALVDLATLASMRLACRQFSVVASHPTVWVGRLCARFSQNTLPLCAELDGSSTRSRFVYYSNLERRAAVTQYLAEASGAVPTHRTTEFKIKTDFQWDTTNDDAGEVARRLLDVGDHLCAAFAGGGLGHATVATRTQATTGADATGRPFAWVLSVLCITPAGILEQSLSEWLTGSTKASRLVSTPCHLGKDRQAFERRISAIRDKATKDPTKQEPIVANLSSLSFAVFCATGILEQDDALVRCLPRGIN
ncbi:F-box domain containing protein [Pandoravirus neocaledonia]|uniref:F-box domain containing protein n=1 Tax=Pandoravirus neocaledonia TaxID=2107708 RepID=A0A2U7UBH9_9VIRU|nr:F-box domain containing protein [Pandoravirus neocaledonia]AVK75715.1 F-box domain containing protein [Pandoravirus neocaledonia]